MLWYINILSVSLLLFLLLFAFKADNPEDFFEFDPPLMNWFDSEIIAPLKKVGNFLSLDS